MNFNIQIIGDRYYKIIMFKIGVTGIASTGPCLAGAESRTAVVTWMRSALRWGIPRQPPGRGGAPRALCGAVLGPASPGLFVLVGMAVSVVSPTCGAYVLH